MREAMTIDNNRHTPAPSFLILTLILNDHQCHRCTQIFRENRLCDGIILLGQGTVESPTLNLLGIKSQKRELVTLLLEKEKAVRMLDLFSRALQLHAPGHGIAYLSPVISAGRFTRRKQESGVSECSAKPQNGAPEYTTKQESEVPEHAMKQAGGVAEYNTQKEGGAPAHGEKQEGKEEAMFRKLIVIVNRGMAEDVMDIARSAGVGGGTVLHGRGTGSAIAAKLFGVEIEPEKELVLLLMPSALADTVAERLFQELRLDVSGNGILLIEPVLDVRGLSDTTPAAGKE